VLLVAAAFGVQQYLTAGGDSPATTGIVRAQPFEYADSFEQEFESAAKFQYELQAAQEETRFSERASQFVSPTDDPWSREVEQIQQNLSALESRDGESPFHEE
jgi:hypothetical protein